jgi:peptidoglycan hydrolase-like protein with peptidoglycan-binding domain
VFLLAIAIGSAAAAPAGAATMGDPDVAAAQVGLHAKSLYAGPIDGLLGPQTERAILRFQRTHGLPPSGWVGPLTRAALGRFGSPELGARLLEPEAAGWDVAAVQFLLAWHGFPSGAFDGRFGDHVEAAVLAFQEWAGLPQTGVVGPQTLDALRGQPASCPIQLAWPLELPVGDGFGPRGAGFHPGLDIPAPPGTPVQAAAAGTVVTAGFAPDGYGRRVVVDDGGGVTTIYAHLLRVDVALGETVAPGDEIGLVGSTGESTGPHLHFEVRVRGAAVDPLPALQP